MATFSRSDDLQGASFERADLTAARFDHTDLTGARFTASDLSGVVMRGVDVNKADIDDPWLAESDRFVVNGVDVIPLVEAELNRRFPGRADRQATDPEGLRSAWATLERAWDAALARAEQLPAGAADTSVDGEWSFAQTLRHLVMATDTWLGRAILRAEQPYHPIGQPNTGAERDGLDLSLFRTDVPPYAEVLEARADRQAMVRDYLARTTAEQLAEERTNPWAPQYPETVLSCLHTILMEEWEHLRYALRDLDAV